MLHVQDQWSWSGPEEPQCQRVEPCLGHALSRSASLQQRAPCLTFASLSCFWKNNARCGHDMLGVIISVWAGHKLIGALSEVRSFWCSHVIVTARCCWLQNKQKCITEVSALVADVWFWICSICQYWLKGLIYIYININIHISNIV